MTADLTIKGARRHVVMQAPKNGFFYVLDAATGKLISAEKYAAVNWGREDRCGHRPAGGESCLRAIPAASRRGSRWARTAGHIWQPMAFNPGQGVVYIPIHRGAFSYQNDPNWKFVRGRWNLAQGPGGGFSQPSFPRRQPRNCRPTAKPPFPNYRPMAVFLVAWDPVEQKARWIVAQDTQWNGGVLATAGGLVFGGADKTFNAYDSKTGDKLWSDQTAAAVMAGPCHV